MSTISSSLTATATPTPTNIELSWDAPLHPAFLAYRDEVFASFASLFTPLNTAVLVLLFSLLYTRFLRPSSTSSASLSLPKDQPIVFQTFTPRTLLRFNGHPNPPLNPDGRVYIAVKGKVHDVTSGRNFYGPGGPYENFAGRDATRGLACQSFDEDMLTKDLDGPLDDCSDLAGEQLENLQGWVERFDEKYLVVGKLVAFNSKKSYGH